jgi:hypothetical protein
MLSTQRRLILLGPQPEYQTLSIAADRLGTDGPVAIVTAGWEEDESNDTTLKQALPHASVNLALFDRSERLFKADTELIELLRLRQDELRHLRDVYRLRLDYVLAAARQTLDRRDPLIDLEAEQESAIEMIRQLDRQYFLRTSQICDCYETQLGGMDRPLVVAHRRELEQILDDVRALVISGGHAAIILNRLRIFGLLEMCDHLPIIAWSAGAMALADQIVFFHDSPPQGAGNAEVLRAGMGLFHEFLPLPSARTRLKLDDQTSVALFARRFQRFSCVVFDESTILDRRDGHWSTSDHVEQLDISGKLVPLLL